jgi:transcription termination factor NusB
MNTINLEDYLSEDDKIAIAKDAFREHCAKMVQKDFERIITNSAYHVIWEAVAEQFDGDLEETLKSNVYDIINDMSAFTVFRTHNAWNRTANTPFETLCNSVKANKDLLDAKVKQAIGNLTKKDMKDVALKLVEQKVL